MKYNQPLNRKRILLLIVFGFVFGALLWYFYMGPTLQAYREVHARQVDLEEQKEHALRYLEREEAVEEEWVELQERAETLMLVTSSEMHLVMDELQDLLHKAAVEVQMLRVGQLQEEEDYRVMPVTLRVTGEEMKDLYRVLEELEDFPYLVMVEGVSWDKLDEEHVHRMQLSAYLTFR